MHSHHTINTPKRICFIDITQTVKNAVKKSGVTEGTALVFIPHTTAGVTINENGDPDVLRDLAFALERTVPNQGFHHFENNSDSHTKTLLTGPSLSLIITGGHLVLGTWQSVYFAEYDGPRHRNIHIKITEG
ncbi:MAG: secondary thiamine-phosphate synthase enzyme YjbQ [Eubacteriales bacterium]